MAGDVAIEEAVAGSRIDVRIAANPGLLHLRLEFTQHLHGHEFVLVAEEHDRRRRVFTDVVSGREFLVSLAHALITPLARAIIQNRIE